MYNLSKEQINKIISHFGEQFYRKILKVSEKYSDIWKLSDFEHVEYYSINCIFKCHSEIYGNSILKIGNPCKEVTTEYNALKEYNGNRFCKVFGADTENGIILEELISPGIRLREESDIDKRLSVFCKLFLGLHIKPKTSSYYPTYIDWVNRITQYMKKRMDYKELALHMEKAGEICRSLCEKYTHEMLLHGDFHHDNILLSNNNRYVIVDPKGVVGDPVFDIPRFILNEFENEMNQDFYKKIIHIVNTLSKKLNVPSRDIRQLIYIETAMSECWNVESSQKPIIENINFAEKIMNEAIL